MFHVPESLRIKSIQSESLSPNNGAFRINFQSREFFAIATDGEGWEHVSVSTSGRVPSWKEMCHMKDLFWDEDDRVVQFHPPKSEYVNHHPFCLHLWRPVGIEFPHPPSELVGPK